MRRSEHAKAPIDSKAAMAALLAPIPNGRRLGKKLQVWHAQLLGRLLSLAPDLGPTTWHTKTYCQRTRALHLVVCTGRTVLRVTITGVARAEADKVVAQVEREQGVTFSRTQ